jgi:hypothetical protein
MTDGRGQSLEIILNYFGRPKATTGADMAISLKTLTKMDPCFEEFNEGLVWFFGSV